MANSLFIQTTHTHKYIYITQKLAKLVMFPLTYRPLSCNPARLTLLYICINNIVTYEIQYNLKETTGKEITRKKKLMKILQFVVDS
jgi:hypothetical protein